MFHVEIGQLLGSLVDGLDYSEASEGNVFIDHLPSTPDRAVGVYTQPGLEADSKLPYDSVRFQVITRSEDGGVWALTMWDAVYDVLQGRRGTVGSAYAVGIICMAASPVPLEPDENGRFRYSGQYRAEVYNPTTQRPA